jgi:hypothetical protein
MIKKVLDEPKKNIIIVIVVSTVFILFCLLNNNKMSPFKQTIFVPSDSNLEELLKEGHYKKCQMTTGIGLILKGSMVVEAPRTYPANSVIELGSIILNPLVIEGTAGTPVKIKWKTSSGEEKNQIFKRVVEKKCFKN